MMNIWGRLLATIFILMSVTGYSQVSEEKLINEVESYRAVNNLLQTAAALNKLAFYYWENELYEKAIQSFEQSISLNKEIGNDNAIKAIYSNIGMIHSDLGQLETSLVFFRKSLMLSKKLNNKQDIGTNLINIGVALNSMDRAEEALQNLNEANAIASEISDKKLLRTSYGLLAEVHEKLGNSQESMNYFNLYATFEKQLQKEVIEKEQEESQRKVSEMKQVTQKAIHEKEQTAEKLEITEGSLKVSKKLNELRKIEIAKQKAEIKNQRLMIMISVIGLAFVFIVAMFILRSYQQKKKHNKALEIRNEAIRQQNEQIKEKNLKINQSINYAKNIQGALLPQQDSIKNIFPESFVFFSPRDVVSGDFYWFNQIEKNNTTYKIAAAVDCTGHGVPGAFMSMLGLSFLEEIVLDKKIVDPAEILESMHKMIKYALKQDTSGNMDGMDMTVCVYEEAKKCIYFAGAVNPLIYFQNNEMFIQKGNFFGIGGPMKDAKEINKLFETFTIDCNIPTTCYIFSDGFADQFGGDQGRKYFSKNFRKLLETIHEKPMDEQHNILDTELKKWHGEKYNRLDDVLVIGFKV
ncbi:MAG: tetratricopeptide repeat protein [Salinivirgaceae bacterium]|nr:tetratricopeptide repeat protein [Salinivirgaceae bacterium]